MNTKKYTALTIDTSIFDQNALKLKKGALATLKQFKDLPINFILSDIVEREVIKHLNKKEMEAIEKLNQQPKMMIYLIIWVVMIDFCYIKISY